MHNMVKIRLHVPRVRRLLYVSVTSLISVVTHIIRSFRHQFAVACIGLVEGSLVLAQSHVHETVSVRIELVVGLVVGQQGFSEHHVSDSVRWTCCWSTRPSEHHVSDTVRCTSCWSTRLSEHRVSDSVRCTRCWLTRLSEHQARDSVRWACCWLTRPF